MNQSNAAQKIETPQEVETKVLVALRTALQEFVLHRFKSLSEYRLTDTAEAVTLTSGLSTEIEGVLNSITTSLFKLAKKELGSGDPLAVGDTLFGRVTLADVRGFEAYQDRLSTIRNIKPAPVPPNAEVGFYPLPESERGLPYPPSATLISEETARYIEKALVTPTPKVKQGKYEIISESKLKAEEKKAEGTKTTLRPDVRQIIEFLNYNLGSDEAELWGPKSVIGGRLAKQHNLEFFKKHFESTSGSAGGTFWQVRLKAVHTRAKAKTPKAKRKGHAKKRK